MVKKKHKPKQGTNWYIKYLNSFLIGIGLILVVVLLGKIIYILIGKLM